MRRRGRGQHRKPGQHHHQQHHHQGRNQTFDSNGPGVRLRGTAHQIYEKYLMLGRDSASSGDRIMSESYLQHADHYYRHVLTNQGPIEQFQERHDGQDGETEAEANTYGQGEQPMAGEGQQPQAAYSSTVPQTQGFNGAGPSQGTSLPGGNQPRHEGQREGRDNRGNDNRGNDNRGNDNRGNDSRGNDNRGNDNRGNESRGNESRSDGDQGGQNQNFRRDRFNRRFRNRDDRGPNQDQGGERNERNDRNDRGPDRNERGGGERQGREQREDRPHRDSGREDRGNRQPRHEEEAFEPPAFLKAERPAGETPPRDPFNRDDEQR